VEGSCQHGNEPSGSIKQHHVTATEPLHGNGNNPSFKLLIRQCSDNPAINYFVTVQKFEVLDGISIILFQPTSYLIINKLKYKQWSDYVCGL
jgi:hypothetical protein